MLKIAPHPDYPPEEGRYVRGNDFSPVAVAIVLNCDADKIPPDLERLVRVGVEMGGPESEGHRTGEALKALLGNGVDDHKRIIGTSAPHPLLYNISTEMIERFRRQVQLLDLQFEGDPAAIRQAVWSCYQESPVDFRGYVLCDPGAFPEPPLSGRITWRVTQPWAEPTDESEREALSRAKQLIERLKGVHPRA